MKKKEGSNVEHTLLFSLSLACLSPPIRRSFFSLRLSVTLGVMVIASDDYYGGYNDGYNGGGGGGGGGGRQGGPRGVKGSCARV